MARELDLTQKADVQADVIRGVWIVRLDIEDDEVLVWTGRGLFAPTGSGDADLDGRVFTGSADILDIGAIQDTAQGSKALSLKFPGIDLSKPLLVQLLNNPLKWQTKDAWIWFGVLDPVTNKVEKPIRVKTGRIDTMKLENDGNAGSVEVIVESHQSFISRALGTKYSEQRDIDPTDTSQDFIHDLANKRPGTDPAAGIATVSSGGDRNGTDFANRGAF